MAFYWRKFSSGGGGGANSAVHSNNKPLEAVVEERRQRGSSATVIAPAGADHWVQQTVMGVLRWRDPTSSTMANSTTNGGGAPMNRHSIEVCCHFYIYQSLCSK